MINELPNENKLIYFWNSKTITVDRISSKLQFKIDKFLISFVYLIIRASPPESDHRLDGCFLKLLFRLKTVSAVRFFCEEITLPKAPLNFSGLIFID